MVDPMEQVPYFGEKFKEKRLEGEKIGMALALKESIREVLMTRFGHNGRRGSVNGKIERMLDAIDDPKELRVILRHALKAESLGTIVNMLQKRAPSTKRKTVKA